MAYRAHAPFPLDLRHGPLYPPPTLAQAELPEPPATPTKLLYNNFKNWAHQLADLGEVRDILVKEMTGNFIGAMPADAFVGELMNCEDIGPVPKVDFTNVPFGDAEREMYTPFVRVQVPSFGSSLLSKTFPSVTRSMTRVSALDLL